MSSIRILKNLFIISIFFTACNKNNKPEPVIAHLSNFTPQHAVAGTTIIITGQGFSPIPADNKIAINGVAVSATQATDTSLSVIVPQKVGSGPISVTVNNQTTISSTNFIYDKAYWVTTVAGSSQGYLDGNAESAQFYNPIGVVEDANGNIYVSDSHNNRIRKIDPGGNVTTLAGSGTAGNADGTGTAAQFNQPYGLAIDKNGNIYVADILNNSIRKISSSGVVTTVGTVGNPTGIAIDNSGNFYISSNTGNRIFKMTSSGQVSVFAGGGPTGFTDGQGTAALFNGLWSIAIDPSGNLFVIDSYNDAVRKIDSLGNVTTFAGNGTAGYLDGQGTNARLNLPFALATDANGNVIVADSENFNIRKITPDGNVTTLAGGRQAGYLDGIGKTAEFQFTEGIFVDSNGAIIVADTNNNKIRKITYQ